ncbi:MAG: mycothiol transferase [Acidimicrobiales bacterium]
MHTNDLLVDAFQRVRDGVHPVVQGLTPEQLTARLNGHANSIAWLVWHLARVQDHHVSDAAGTEQVWTAGGFERRFGLPFEPGATGYGHGPKDVAAVKVASGELLTDYFEAVHRATLRFVERLTDADLDRVVDTSWDPPVTLGVRLVSVIDDDLEHVGQAAFVRGLLEQA